MVKGSSFGLIAVCSVAFEVHFVASVTVPKETIPVRRAIPKENDVLAGTMPPPVRRHPSVGPMPVMRELPNYDSSTMRGEPVHIASNTTLPKEGMPSLENVNETGSYDTYISTTLSVPTAAIDFDVSCKSVWETGLDITSSWFDSVSGWFRSSLADGAPLEGNGTVAASSSSLSVQNESFGKPKNTKGFGCHYGLTMKRDTKATTDAGYPTGRFRFGGYSWYYWGDYAERIIVSMTISMPQKSWHAEKKYKILKEVYNFSIPYVGVGSVALSGGLDLGFQANADATLTIEIPIDIYFCFSMHPTSGVWGCPWGGSNVATVGWPPKVTWASNAYASASAKLWGRVILNVNKVASVYGEVSLTGNYWTSTNTASVTVAGHIGGATLQVLNAYLAKAQGVLDTLTGCGLGDYYELPASDLKLAPAANKTWSISVWR